MTLERYELIKPTLEAYERPFIMLDLGAGIGPVISAAAAREYPNSTFVIIERDFEDVRNLPDNVIALTHNMTPLDIERLSQCEHFDVVLALNFLHHFGGMNWRLAANSVLEMGDHIFLQMPDVRDFEAPGSDYRRSLRLLFAPYFADHNIIGHTVQFPSHKSRALIYVNNHMRREANKLTRTHIRAHPKSANTMMITSGTDSMALIKGNKYKNWIPAINLWNACLLGVVHPEPMKIINMLRDYPLPDKRHGDMVPHNFLLNAQGLHLIDGFEGWEFDDKENMEKTIAKVAKTLGVKL